MKEWLDLFASNGINYCFSLQYKFQDNVTITR